LKEKKQKVNKQILGLCALFFSVSATALGSNCICIEPSGMHQSSYFCKANIPNSNLGAFALKTVKVYSLHPDEETNGCFFKATQDQSTIFAVSANDALGHFHSR
jgi:hypothetical protein